MSIETVNGTGLKYYLIAFDAEGRERTDDPDGLMSEVTLNALRSEPVTDVFIFSHGWQGDVPGAKEQYGRWIAAMVERSDDLARMRQIRQNFHPLLVALHWMSLPWGDEGLGGGDNFAAPRAAQPMAAMIEQYAARLADTDQARQALRTIFEAARTDVAPPTLPDEVRQAYEILNREADLGGAGEGAAPGDDRDPFDPEDTYQLAQEDEDSDFGSFGLGGLLAPLRTLSFWKMKSRARSFGEGGACRLLRQLQEALPAGHFHLMGHSFGCIVVSAMLGGPDGRGQVVRPVDSVALVQGALSLWSYCPDIPRAPGRPGYFHRVIADHSVRGPIITTQSQHDRAVARIYPIAAGVSRDAAFGDLPKYGGLGAFGVRGLKEEGADAEVIAQKMLPADADYNFRPGKIYNLESSDFINKGGGLSGAHSDIAKPAVAHAVWAAAYALGKRVTDDAQKQ